MIGRAKALRLLGRFDLARAALKEGAPIAERPDAPRNLSAFYYLTMARIALSERQFPEAQAKSERAVGLAGTEVKDAAVAATFTLGLAQALSGLSRQALLKCQEAVDKARESRDPSLLSEALLSLAEVMVQNGDAAGALKNAWNPGGLCALRKTGF